MLRDRTLSPSSRPGITGDNHVTCVQMSKPGVKGCCDTVLPTIALLVAKRKVSDRCFCAIFCILCELDP